MSIIYMDYAATSPVRSEVLEAMLPYLKRQFGNPSAVYQLGQDAKGAIETARERVAAVLSCTSREVFFTSGGTESVNWAISGAARARKDTGRHIITSRIEHHCVLHTCQSLEKEGFEVTYLPVDRYGIIDIKELEGAIRDDTTLVSVMLANNEVGVVQPLADIARLTSSRGILLHTDAVQAFGHIHINVHELGADMLSVSGHKLGAPKGVGGLYIRSGIKLDNLLFGGGQERGRRAGTENVAGIVAMGVASALATEDMEAEAKRITDLREILASLILPRLESASRNGSPDKTLPGILNLSFKGIEGESLLLLLSQQGICASAGSACASGSLEASHVLASMGVPKELAQASLRLSLGRETTPAEVSTTADAVTASVRHLLG